MLHPPRSATLPDLQTEQEPSAAFLTQCHRNALDQLRSSFSAKRPLAILTGDGKTTSRFVIRKFLSRLDADVAVALFARPSSTDFEFMTHLIAAVGFQPNDMSLSDLENIFSMFLSFQKSHNRRTIICIEEAQLSEWWLLDKIRALVETECKDENGLLLILSGQTELDELLENRPLSSVTAFADEAISLAPFTLPESREFIRRRAEAAVAANNGKRFHAHAIPLIHELCAGVPDAIGTLVNRCFVLAREQDMDPITKELVKRAYEGLREQSAVDDDDLEATAVNVTPIRPRGARLIVKLTGNDVKEMVLRQSRILIGRNNLCDIRIDSNIVSRHHALISYSADGATIIDLGSTNGTTVNGIAIKEHQLEPGETIVVGDCRIEYVLDDDFRAQQRSPDNAESADHVGQESFAPN